MRLLAEKLFEIENADFKQRILWQKAGVNNWVLAKHISARKSADGICWYLSKYDPNQDRTFIKVVPAAGFEVSVIENILEAQPWVLF